MCTLLVRSEVQSGLNPIAFLLFRNMISSSVIEFRITERTRILPRQFPLGNIVTWEHILDILFAILHCHNHFFSLTCIGNESETWRGLGIDDLQCNSMFHQWCKKEGNVSCLCSWYLFLTKEDNCSKWEYALNSRRWTIAHGDHVAMAQREPWLSACETTKSSM